MAELDLAARALAEEEGLSYERAMVRLQHGQIEAVQSAQWDRDHPPVYGPPAPAPAPGLDQIRALTEASRAMAQSLQARFEELARTLNASGFLDQLRAAADQLRAAADQLQGPRPRRPYRPGATMKPRDLKKPPRDLGATSIPPPPPRRPRP